MPDTRSRQAVAAACFGLGMCLCALSAVAAAQGPLTWAALRSGGVVSNTVLGAAFVVAALPMAWARPGNALSWLVMGAGLGFAASGAGYATLAWQAMGHPPQAGWSVVADIANVGWPFGVGVVLPLIGLLFPDGRLPSGRWRPLARLAVINGVVFIAVVSLGRETSTTALGVRGHLHWHALDHADWLGAVVAAIGFATYGAALTACVQRYRGGDDRTRRQLLWLSFGLGVTVTLFVVSDVLGLDLLGALGMVALPMSILVAVLRHQLLDIRVVVARSLVLFLLVAGIVGCYTAVVAISGVALSDRVRFGPPVMGIVAVALGLNPARLALQRVVHRWLYGASGDPAAAAHELGQRMREVELDDAAGLVQLLASLCDLLRLPWARLENEHEVIAGHGVEDGAAETLTLSASGRSVGALRVGLRGGERRLRASDRQVLELVSHSIAVAVHATALAAEVTSAKHALVNTREEERRRLRQELHDGVGPVLTGVMLTADAARRTTTTDSERAASLMADVRHQAALAIEEVRRLARGLRPPALDALGLAGALREHAETLAPLQVEVVVDGLGDLPASIEVAAYRIATEALNNVARHAGARHAAIELRHSSGALVLTVRDDGRSGADWVPGVGLTSMRERAEEVGGTLHAGPAAAGGCLVASFPLELQ